jgi:hypothetical protein
VHSPLPPRRTLTRRTALGVLTAGSAAALAGCTPSGIDRRPRKNASAAPTPDADPDVALAATVLADEQAMLDLIAATVARHPGLEARLAMARDSHQAHVDLLTKAVPNDARVSPGASPSTDTSPSVSRSGLPSPTGPPTVPARRPRAVAALADAEDRLALVGRRSAFAARSGVFARVLAGMSASAAQHAVALGVTGVIP